MSFQGNKIHYKRNTMQFGLAVYRKQSFKNDPTAQPNLTVAFFFKPRNLETKLFLFFKPRHTYLQVPHQLCQHLGIRRSLF
mmetsp:Transcript_29186/g.70365  ORF Transcript_29186/g.70365 Transcript_29186/m.70365 type:complete len:81 (+) Transcript_29186:706-948(+)